MWAFGAVPTIHPTRRRALRAAPPRVPRGLESPHPNRIEGTSRPSLGGGKFALAAPTGEPLGSWTRSGAEDLRLALDALARGTPTWAARPPSERCRRLADALRRWGADPDPEGLVGPALGLDPGEAPEVALALERARGELSGAETPPGRPVLVAAHWSELHGGVAARSLGPLASGGGVVLLSDPRCPGLASGWWRAAVEAGVDPGALALLHDDTWTVLRAARDDAPRVRVCASFGEEGSPGPGTASVLEGDDLGASALAVARGAFGRRRALGGQRAGALARVLCAPRCLSAFTQALLEVLEGSEPDLRPLPFVEAATAPALERLRERGLDEGATLVHGLRDSRGPGRDGRLVRLVFTNVEAHMRFAPPARPLPVLLLLREGRSGGSRRGSAGGSGAAGAVGLRSDRRSRRSPSGGSPVAAPAAHHAPRPCRGHRERRGRP